MPPTLREVLLIPKCLASLSSEQRSMIVPPTFRRLVMNVTIAVIASFVPALSLAASAADATNGRATQRGGEYLSQ